MTTNDFKKFCYNNEPQKPKCIVFVMDDGNINGYLKDNEKFISDLKRKTDLYIKEENKYEMNLKEYKKECREKRNEFWKFVKDSLNIKDVGMLIKYFNPILDKDPFSTAQYKEVFDTISEFQRSFNALDYDELQIQKKMVDMTEDLNRKNSLLNKLCKCFYLHISDLTYNVSINDLKIIHNSRKLEDKFNVDLNEIGECFLNWVKEDDWRYYDCKDDDVCCMCGVIANDVENVKHRKSCLVGLAIQINEKMKKKEAINE